MEEQNINILFPEPTLESKGLYAFMVPYVKNKTGKRKALWARAKALIDSFSQKLRADYGEQEEDAFKLWYELIAPRHSENVEAPV